MHALASDEQRSTLERAHGELRDAVMSVHNLNQLLRSIRVGSQAVAAAVRDMDAACAPTFVSASRDLLHTLETCLGEGSTGTLGTLISERCLELEQALKDTTPLTTTRRLRLEHVSGRFIQDLDSALVLIELLREVTTNAPSTIDLSHLIQQRLSSDAASSSQARSIKASISVDSGGIEVECNPRALILLSVLSAAFVTSDAGDGCHIALTRHAGAKAALSIEPKARAENAIDLPSPRLLKASKACVASAARALGARIEWCHAPRTASLIWAES